MNIKQHLSDRFTQSESMADILELALLGGKNCIVFGPGGHAKSEMTAAAIECLGLQDDCFVQFFGEGMDEARLFGGLDFKKLEEEKILEYHVENSFLNARVAVFEELFDAPPQVLLSLKDVLTAKELRNGAQRFKMRTETIIVLTNKEPSEISELGPSAHALIERFPLQLDLRWSDYSASRYLEMFEKVAPRLSGPSMNGFDAILADILAKATEEGNFVSPRTAVHAFELCQTAAKIRGAAQVEQQDLTKLKYLPGLEGLAETIEQDLIDAMERTQAETSFFRLESKFEQLYRELASATTPIQFLMAANNFLALQDEVADLRITDHLSARRRMLRDNISEVISQAQTSALETTKVSTVYQ